MVGTLFGKFGIHGVDPEYWTLLEASDQEIPTLFQGFKPENFLIFELSDRTYRQGDPIGKEAQDRWIEFKQFVQMVMSQLGYPISHRPSQWQNSGIVIERVEGDQTRTIILDPKYRVRSDAIKSALGDMHKYKDALVDENQNKLVKAAYILIPNVPSEIDIQERYLSMEYKSKHGFGVCVLRPGEQGGLEEIEKLLKVNGLIP